MRASSSEHTERDLSGPDTSEMPNPLVEAAGPTLPIASGDRGPSPTSHTKTAGAQHRDKKVSSRTFHKKDNNVHCET